jgi:hypothetical protein
MPEKAFAVKLDFQGGRGKSMRAIGKVLDRRECIN